MSESAIRVENLGKLYRIGQHERYKTLGGVLYTPFRRISSAVRAKRLPFRDQSPNSNYLWALKGVSLEVRRGEVVGIIGRNGAGKTTVLKILSRITQPTEGYAEICGRVGSLLEVGTGFHPELTGRENVYLNGAILGMKKAEIERKFDEIVAFAEVERFIDTPVKYYSSGMYVRLAFAVAAHLETEILLVDEVLAVGDTGFQKKCLGKMGDVAKMGRTVLFVSHNLGAIAELCSRGILLDRGQKLADCEVSRALSEYLKEVNARSETVPGVSLDKDPTLPCSILEIAVSNGRGASGATFDLSDDIVISIKYELGKAMRDLMFNVTLARNAVHILNSFDTDGESEVRPKDPGLYVARHVIPAMFLKAGLYSVSVGVGTPEHCFQLLPDILHFEVEEVTHNTHLRGYRRDRLGHVISPGSWETIKLEETW